MITAKELVLFVLMAFSEKWGYVWGGQGQLYTKALAEKWGKAKRSGKSWEYYVVQCAKWIGHIIVDCSGLIVEAFRSKNPKYSDRSSTTFYKQCVEKGPIGAIPEIPGLCVWRPGHIGVYIGNGEVIEAGGWRKGVVKTALGKPATGKAWTHWGKLKDVDYDEVFEIPDNVEPEDAFRLGRLLKYNPKKPKEYMQGSDVLEVQIALKAADFAPGKLDGKYGPMTEAAVKAYQKAKNLKVDGIVGPRTTDALGGVWTK